MLESLGWEWTHRYKPSFQEDKAQAQWLSLLPYHSIHNQFMCSLHLLCRAITKVVFTLNKTKVTLRATTTWITNSLHITNMIITTTTLKVITINSNLSSSTSQWTTQLQSTITTTESSSQSHSQWITMTTRSSRRKSTLFKNKHSKTGRHLKEQKLRKEMSTTSTRLRIFQLRQQPLLLQLSSRFRQKSSNLLHSPLQQLQHQHFTLEV